MVSILVFVVEVYHTTGLKKMHVGAKERHFQIAKDWYNNVTVKVTFI